MAYVKITTNDPRFAMGLKEGANTVELKRVSAENERLKAREGVRRNADDKRWQRTQRRLARKYAVQPVGRARGAILGVWALAWMSIFDWVHYFQNWNRAA